jgi:hypothetical protein
VTARETYGDQVIYDVTYTIDVNGLRVTPPATGQPRGCVVFFGDSMTFGEGVEDKQTLPYQVALKTAGNYVVYNFAFSGYGPHQMLAILQTHREAHILKCRPTHFIYLAIPEHVERVAGMTSWDKHGPRFRKLNDGRVVREGNFDSPSHAPIVESMLRAFRLALEDSLTWQKLFLASHAGPESLELMIAVILEAAKTAKARYPGSEFHVLLRDSNDGERVGTIERTLLESGVPVHRETTAIPDFRAGWRKYVLSEHDLHPNPTELELVAGFITTKILMQRSVSN